MAKILDNNTITGSIQKVVETPSGYIINGHYYDKLQMIPKAFKLFPALGDTTDVSMSQKITVNHTLVNHCKTQGDTVVTDRYDTTISYVWVVAVRSNTMRLMKIKENNGDVSLQNSVAYPATPTTSPTVRAYCGQDNTYLYYLISCAGTYHEYFVKVDKSSLTMTVVEDLSTYAWSSFLKETATHIYYARKQGYGTNFIKRYNKTTAVTDTFTVTAKTSNIYFSSCFSDLVVISDTEFYVYSVYHNQTTNKYGFTRYHFDTTQSTLATICTEADPTITWGTITQLPVFASNGAVTYEPFITTSGSNKYLNVAVYANANDAVPANLTGYGIYTFLIDTTNNTLAFKSFVQPTVDYFRGFIGLKTNTFLVCASPTTCIFMNFDSVNEKFVITDTLSNQPSHLGSDEADNIWIVNGVGEIEYLSPFVPTNINVKFELGSYKYLGSDISSYVTINCMNFSGSYIATNIQLTLKGNAVFSSNNSKVITVSTLTTGDLQVPIKVQDKGGLTVYPVLLM